MIFKFGCNNVYSFREGIELSFENKNNNTINRVLGINGANGAGKTNLLKAFC